MARDLGNCKRGPLTMTFACALSKHICSILTNSSSYLSTLTMLKNKMKSKYANIRMPAVRLLTDSRVLIADCFSRTNNQH